VFANIQKELICQLISNNIAHSSSIFIQVAHREVVAEIRGRAQNATLAAARQVAYANARVEEASAALEVASERATVSADAAKRAAKEALAHESVSTAHAKVITTQAERKHLLPTCFGVNALFQCRQLYTFVHR